MRIYTSPAPVSRLLNNINSDYNYSTVKRAPPKTPKVPTLVAGNDLSTTSSPNAGNEFALDEIMASLDKLEQATDPDGKFKLFWV